MRTNMKKIRPVRQTTIRSEQNFPTRSGMVWHFLQGSKRWFVLSIVFACLTSVLDLLNPKIISYTVDSVIDSKPSALTGPARALIESSGGAEGLRNHLWLVAAAVCVVALLANACRYANRLMNSLGAECLVKRMRDQLFDHIEHLPFAWHSENHTGDIIQRCTSDVETIKNFVSEQLTSLFRIVILMSFALYYMDRIHPILTAVSAAFFPIIILYSLFFHRRIGNAFQHADEEEGKLSAIAQENLTGVRVVRAFGREIYERERFEKQNRSYTAMWIRLMKLLSAFWCSSDLISGLQVMLITVIGAVFCVRGQITSGQYIAFIYYNSMLTWPVRSLGRVVADMSKAGISIDRLRYIMNSETEQDKKDAKMPPMDRDISFQHVSYQYENGSAEVLKDVTFTIPAGSTVGILGGTGSGKSTLMYLLDRLYPLSPENGRIEIGGVDIADISSDWLRRNIGMVLQEPFLFSRTLEENIAIASGQEPEDGKDGEHSRLARVRSAARIARLDETITHFAKGYDTFVGERGVTLSGGQKQRTAIAQMLIRKPPVMVFDDSLSAVDAETDAEIRRALRENVGSATVILIAHRLTTLMHADQILVMDQGRLVQRGTHEELLAQDGIYRQIYDLQVRQSGSR